MILSPLLLALTLAAPAPDVTISFEGPLKTALEQVAHKGRLNVVVTADLDEAVKVNLASMPADEALEAIAKIYKLEVKKEGRLWVIRRSSEAAPVVEARQLTKKPDGLEIRVNEKRVLSFNPDSIREVAELARNKAEAARENAELIREQAREFADQKREEADAIRDQAQELADQKREQADALREHAQDLAEAERERAEAMREHAAALQEAAEAQAEAEEAAVEAAAGAEDLVATGRDLEVPANSTAEKAICYGGNIKIGPNAVVKGDAVSFGGNVELGPNARVKGDAVSFGGKVVKGPNARVDGEEISMGSGGIGHAVASRVARGKASDHGEHHGFTVGRSLGQFMLSFAVFFGLGFLLMMFAPQRMRQLEAAVAQHPVRNAFTGILALLVAVVLTVLFTVTLIGIPLALVTALATPVAMLAGIPAIANVIGARLPTGRLRRTQALVLAIGLAVLLLTAQVPILGPTVMVIASLVSVGAIVRTRFGQTPRGTPVPDDVAGQPA